MAVVMKFLYGQGRGNSDGFSRECHKRWHNAGWWVWGV